MDGYRAEGVPVDDITFRDNSKCVELIEAGKQAKEGVGILMKLDEEIKRPKSTDESFAKRLANDFVVPKGDDKEQPAKYFRRVQTWPIKDFAIAHFAGEVMYNVEGFQDILDHRHTHIR